MYKVNKTAENIKTKMYPLEILDLIYELEHAFFEGKKQTNKKQFYFYWVHESVT